MAYFLHGRKRAVVWKLHWNLNARNVFAMRRAARLCICILIAKTRYLNLVTGTGKTHLSFCKPEKHLRVAEKNVKSKNKRLD